MSVTAYFTKNKPELKMPKSDTEPDSLGIRYEGPVLSGRVGVQHQLQNHAANSPQTSAQIRALAPGGLTCLPPSAYVHATHDPRLQPDPLRAAQRESLGNRPELYDPVLRFHTGRPPLPDPYESRHPRAQNKDEDSLP